MAIIYKITHKKTGKSYIGQTRGTLKARLKAHLRAPSAIGSALRSHGREAFTVEVLHANVPVQNLNPLERTEIAMRGTIAPSGYNIAPGGQPVKSIFDLS